MAGLFRVVKILSQASAAKMRVYTIMCVLAMPHMSDGETNFGTLDLSNRGFCLRDFLQLARSGFRTWLSVLVLGIRRLGTTFPLTRQKLENEDRDTHDNEAVGEIEIGPAVATP